MARSTAVEDVRVNPGSWFDLFKESKGLVACFIEVLKNGFDWYADQVRIITENRAELRHIDNGRGMNAANRVALLSVGYSTATRGEQSGTFGTGAKKLIFTYASRVRVVTVSADDPGYVWVADFTPEELAAVYSNPGSGSQFWKRVRKTQKLWPHNHETGTDTTYTLRNPRSGSIRRGADLAQVLSERLPLTLIESGMVLVDGKRLPAKQIEGRVYTLELDPESPLGRAMGRVKLVLYRPKHRSPIEDLLMTNLSMGEVSFRSVLMKQLPRELRELVPALFLEDDVCGLITAAFLGNHVTEHRDSYDPDIIDDPKLRELLRMLQSVEAEVAEYLGITLKQDDDPEIASRAGVQEFIDGLQSRYNPEHLVPAGYTPVGGEDAETPPSPSRPGRSRPPAARGSYLQIERPEFAVGETIEARLVVPHGTTEGYSFYLDQSHGQTVFIGDGVVRLLAREPGRGLIRAVNPRTSDVAKAEYEVVERRVFHLSASGRGLQVGSQLAVYAVNADKLPSGKLSWALDGAGELQVTHRGLAVRMTAIRPGKAQIIAYDSEDPEVRAVWEVMVLSGESTGEMPFCIVDQFFTLEFLQTNLHGFYKPVTIIRTSGVHRLIVNTISPGFQEAVRSGALQTLLAYAAAVEFAKNFQIEEHVGNGSVRGTVPRNWSQVPSDDIEVALLEVQNLAAQLFSEMRG